MIVFQCINTCIIKSDLFGEHKFMDDLKAFIYWWFQR